MTERENKKYEDAETAIKADEWDTMSGEELNQQLEILYDRLNAAIAINNPMMIQMIQQAITTLHQRQTSNEDIIPF
jgi:hypothetical protein